MSELPSGWVEASLGEVCHKPQYGWTTKAASGTTGLRLLRTTDITRGSIDWASVPFCVNEPPSPEKYLLVSDDIVISRAGSVGFSVRVRGYIPPAVFASYLIRFRAVEGVEPAYIEWFLRSPSYWKQVGQAAVGIALANVNAKKLAAVVLPVPPLAEQRRIVAAIEEQFSRLDATRTALDVAYARLRGLRESTIDCQLWRKSFDHAPIGTRAELIRGVTYKKHEARAQSEPGLAPLLRATNINGTLALDQDLVYVPTSRVSEAQQLRIGDIVVATSSGSPAVVGKSALLRAQWNGTFGAFCAVVRASPVIDPSYLALVLESRRVRERWSELARGTNINNLRAAHILETHIPVPPLDEQRRITAELEQQLSLIDSLRAAVESAQKRSATLRRAILQRAFHGELVSQDPDDEPASVLLERIRAERAALPKPGRRRKTAV